MIITLTKCPLCGGAGFRQLTVPGHWIGREIFGPLQGQLGLSRCRTCGFTFTNPRPAPELLDRFYSGNAYSCHKPNTAAPAVRVATYLLSLLDQPGQPKSPGKRLLDFGCGGGFLLRCARNIGWDASGFDPGEEARRACREQGLPVFDSLETLPAKGFDVVLLSHVLEHVEDFDGLFAVCRRILAPQGRLFIKSPNAASLRARLAAPLLSRHAGFDERYRAFPIHLSYFTSGTLQRLLETHGFEVTMSSTSGMGLEEIILRPEPEPEHEERPTSQASTPPPSRPARPSTTVQAAKTAVKNCFHSLKLGEYLLAIATPRA
jgi:SAM-dependent methyltransferase